MNDYELMFELLPVGAVRTDKGFDVQFSQFKSIADISALSHIFRKKGLVMRFTDCDVELCGDRDQFLEMAWLAALDYMRIAKENGVHEPILDAS